MMGGTTVDGPNGPMIKSVGEMFGRFVGETTPLLGAWQQKLADDPGKLEELEQEIGQSFARGAGLVVAGLVSVVMQTPELAEASERTRQEFNHPLARGRNRTIAVRLLGGVMMWVTSLYCEPRRGLFRKPGDHVAGLNIEMAQFGFGKKVSPGLETRVARQSALCPSFELAHAELERGGLKIDLKTVRRVSHQCGDELLKLRTSQLLQWRSGELISGNELAGKRVAVQIDGGRVRTRGSLRKSTAGLDRGRDDGQSTSDVPGRSKPRPKRSFDAEWREPKLMTIFIHNEHGRMKKHSQATIDGTLTGPDATAELVSMHLHRLGAAKAESISFVGDGAVWIWDRIDAIVSQAGIPQTVKVHQVLDNCHAVHHVSLALAALGMAEEDRLPQYRELRTRLRNGQWRHVVNELQQRADDNPKIAKLQTEVNYLRKHGDEGRLNYPKFRSLGIPLGSGAIESCIRRVINLRLKGNGIFWKEANAESMLQLRALVISDRWDEQIRLMRNFKRKHHDSDWYWSPQPMSSSVEHETTSGQNSA